MLHFFLYLIHSSFSLCKPFIALAGLQLLSVQAIHCSRMQSLNLANTIEASSFCKRLTSFIGKILFLLLIHFDFRILWIPVLWTVAIAFTRQVALALPRRDHFPRQQTRKNFVHLLFYDCAHMFLLSSFSFFFTLAYTLVNIQHFAYTIFSTLSDLKIYLVIFFFCLSQTVVCTPLWL